jgi:transposase
MGQAIAVRTDFTASEVRRFAKRAKDAAQARRLLAIAAVLDGASREDAAKIGGMDRQTLRDWVMRFNEQGPDGLINIPSPGVPPKLGKKHRAFLLRLVEQGSIPAVHGVVRWRACDLIMRSGLAGQFGEYLVEHPETAPAHEPVVDRLVRTIITRCVTPAQPVLDDEDNPADHSAVINPRDPV